MGSWSTPTRPSSRNSASSPTAGGIPQGEFRPLHDINPLRLDWIDRARAARRRSGARRRLRRRHPRRGDGAARRARHRHRPLGQGAAGGELHLLESALADRVLKAERRRSRGRAPRQVRRRHLHGAARARARAGEHGRRLRAARAPGRPGVLLHHQPQSEVLSLRGDRRRVRARSCCRRARTTTCASSSPPSSRAGAARRACASTS